MKPYKQAKKIEKESNREKIKSSPNKVLTFLIIIVLVLILTALGFYIVAKFFNNQGEINDGFEDVARYTEISVEKAKDMLDNNDDLIIVDVSNNYINGHIPTAINVYLNELENNLNEFEKDDEILVYARFNMNSIEAAKIFTDNEFTNIYRLKGEYDAWVSEGYKIETGEGTGMKKDSDKDGISDKEEKALGTDPKNSDTDDDGLLDGEEIKLGTDITNPDSDQDGFLDGAEVESGYDPNSKPDQEQNKIRELEEINLEDTGISNSEGTAKRYMSNGKYFLEVVGVLPKLEGEGKYLAFLINDITGEKIRIGDLQFEQDYGSNDGENISYAQYEINYETEQDYYNYYVVEVDIQEEKNSTNILRGEFKRSE